MAEPSGRRRRLRAALVNLAILAGAVGVSLLLAEGAVRLVAPQQLILIRPDIWQPADTVGWLHRPNVDAQINTGERTVQIVTDREGFRVARTGRADAATQVLLMGDSFMEALQVEFEDSFAGLLERELAARLGQTVAVRNASVGGWGPNQYLLRTRALLARDTFDLVVVALYVENDAIKLRWDRLPPRQPAERSHFRLPRKLSREELVSAFLAPINDGLEVRLHLYIMLRNQLQTLRMQIGLTPAYFPDYFLKSEAMSERWALTADLSHDLAGAAAARGIPTVFVLIPAPYQVESDVFARYVRGFGLDSAEVDLDQPSRLLFEEFRARDLTVIDALDAFRQAQAAGTPLFGSVDPHLSPEGHRFLTELVTPAAAELLGAPTCDGQAPACAIDTRAATGG